MVSESNQIPLSLGFPAKEIKAEILASRINYISP